MPLSGVHFKYCKIPMNKNDVCPRMCGFLEMVQLTSFSIYKCMRIINLKYSCMFGLQKSDLT